jgi:hypothetical protein
MEFRIFNGLRFIRLCTQTHIYTHVYIENVYNGKTLFDVADGYIIALNVFCKSRKDNAED